MPTPIVNLDFGYNGGSNGGSTTPAPNPVENLDTGKTSPDGTTPIDGGTTPPPEPDKDPKDDKGDGNDTKPKDGKGQGNGEPDANTSPTGGIDVSTLEAGTTIDTPDGTLIVDAQGNLIDKDGNVFKTKDEANDYLNQFDADEDGDGQEEELSIKTIQEAIGVDVVDDKGKKVKFDNTPEGIKSYVNSVMEIRENEIAEAAINRLYQDVPVLPDIINYYVANGGSLEGYNEIPDRTQIVIDENNVSQQKAIIKQAHKEFGRRGDVNKYIKYLEDSGQLLETAKDELAALQQADKEEHEKLRQQAEARIKADEEASEKYWNGVKKVIDSKKIAGYQIPDNIIISRDGKKISATPQDFFNYLYQVDDNGKSRYVYDLEAQTPEARRDDQILRAYLTFVGGNYASLVDMAIKEEKVRTLRMKSKQATAKGGIRVTPPSDTKPKDFDFGY